LFQLIIISLLLGCSENSHIEHAEADFSTILEANQQELKLLLFTEEDDSSIQELVSAANALSTIDLRINDVAYDPDLALSIGVPSNGYAALSRQPTQALASPPSIIFSLTGDIRQEFETAIGKILIPQRNAFIVSTDEGLTFDSTNPSRRNQRLANYLREQGVAVYFDEPNTVDILDSAFIPENNLLILTGKPSTFSAETAALVHDHLMKGGALILAAEPDSGCGNLREVCAALGLEFGQGTLVSEVGQVREEIGQATAQDRRNHSTGAFLSHESNPNLSSRSSSAAQLLVSSASWLEPVSDTTSNFQPTVLSNDAAFGDLNGNGRQDENESSGAKVLAGVTVGGVGQPFKAAILADSSLLSDRWLLHPTNGIFTKDLIAWLLPEAPNFRRIVPNDDATTQADPEDYTSLFTGANVQSITLSDPRRSVQAIIKHDNYGTYSSIIADTARGQELFRGNADVDEFGGDDYSLRYLRMWGPQSVEKLAEFGLDQEGRELSVQVNALNENTSFRFRLGARNNNLNGNYALDLNTDDVYLLNYNDYSALAQPTRAIRDDRFLGKLDWSLIQIELDGRPIRIERRGESWVAGGASADNNAITEWASEVLRLRTMYNEFDSEAVQEVLSFYMTSDSGVISNVKLGTTTSPSGDVVTVGWSAHTREWVGLPPRTADLVASANTLLAQAIRN